MTVIKSNKIRLDQIRSDESSQSKSRISIKDIKYEQCWYGCFHSKLRLVACLGMVALVSWPLLLECSISSYSMCVLGTGSVRERDPFKIGVFVFNEISSIFWEKCWSVMYSLNVWVLMFSESCTLLYSSHFFSASTILFLSCNIHEVQRDVQVLRKLIFDLERYVPQPVVNFNLKIGEKLSQFWSIHYLW